EVGFAGAMYYMVPILWYYEAREAASEASAGKFVNLMIAVTMAGIAYATYQYYYGFTVGEEMWARTSTNGSSLMSGVVLPMSFFSHRGEYVRFVGMVCVILIAVSIHRRN